MPEVSRRLFPSCRQTRQWNALRHEKVQMRQDLPVAQSGCLPVQEDFGSALCSAPDHSFVPGEVHM